MYKTPIDSPEETTIKKPVCPKPPSEECQTHVHEFQGSTKLAEENKERHNHRFAGVSGQVIPFGNSHVHAVFTNTDFFEEHLHEVAGVSGPAIDVGNGKHIHFVKFVTTVDDGHFHEYQFASLIEDPLT
jgi:hypothetical protein